MGQLGFPDLVLFQGLFLESLSMSSIVKPLTSSIDSICFSASKFGTCWSFVFEILSLITWTGKADSRKPSNATTFDSGKSRPPPKSVAWWMKFPDFVKVE